ncbi:MAG: LysR substrate-binding domain-containing protein [Bacteriovoracaceae bacterium]
MNISQLSIRDLEYIVTVSEKLHFGKAALELNVSQPTLSEQIKKVEALLETKIFERSRKSVQLTPQGELLVAAAKLVIQKAQDFIEIAKNKKGPLIGEFHLGAISTVAPYYLPYILKPLRKAFPQLELIIHEGHTDDLLAQLDSGELNAVIASRTFDERNYRVYSLYHEPFWLAVPTEMPIKLRAGKVSVKDIDKDQLILLTDGNCLKDEVLNFCSLSKNKAGAKIQAAGLETLRYLVATGNGYTFMPELALNDDKKLKGLINYYPFLEKSAQREIVLVTREQYARPEEIRMMYQKLKENLPQSR